MTWNGPPGTAPGLEPLGRRALARLGARMALGYLVGASTGVVAGLGAGPPPWWTGLPAAAQVVGLGVVVAVALAGPVSARASRWVHGRGLGAVPAAVRGPLWPALAHLVVVAAGLAVLARLVTLGPTLGWEHVHALVGMVVPGVGLGTALAAGPVRGAVAFAVLGAGFAVMVPEEAAGALPATLAGAAVSVVVAAVVTVLARRGFGTTEAALRAAEDADLARVRAEQRLLARRRLDRMLHDTVLSTLTLLAHGARGLAPAQVRGDCRRDLAALRSDRWSDPVDPVDPAGPAGSAGPASVGSSGFSAGEGSCLGRLPRQVTPIAERLDAVRAMAARRGVDLRVHLESAQLPAGGRSRSDAPLGPNALEAWSSALTECVANITRHAGVTAADVVLGRTDTALVTLVVDEGTGFEAGDVQPERLGLSGSVHERLTDVGGEARVWSRPGQGTVVELVLPWSRGAPAGPEAPR